MKKKCNTFTDGTQPSGMKHHHTATEPSSVSSSGVHEALAPVRGSEGLRYYCSRDGETTKSLRDMLRMNKIVPV